VAGWRGSYGYRKEASAPRPLIISDEPIHGFDLRGEVVVSSSACPHREASCQKIADYLTRAGLPCTSAWNAKGQEPGNARDGGLRSGGIRTCAT